MKIKKAILLSGIFYFTFSVVLYAQNGPPAWVGVSVGSSKQPASDELLKEYAAIISKYDTQSNVWWEKFSKTISVNDKQRLEEIFKLMSEQQQLKQKVAFIKAPQPLKKITPSLKQFNSWKNENVYGIWVDGKKTTNRELNKYKNSDFTQFTVSKLYGAAKKNKKYSHQVDLMTNSYYQNYYDRTIADSGNRMVFRT